MIEKIKLIVSTILGKCGILPLCLKHLLKKYPNTIRIVNYHDTLSKDIDTFEKQLQFYQKYYDNIDFETLQKFLKKEKQLTKQGIVLTFDDGKKDNYTNTLPLLEKYGFTGYFFVSSDLLDKENYMTTQDIQDIVNKGHVVGCHTATHHRMNQNDTHELLYKEIVAAKETLQVKLGSEISCFCWCGGELDTYTHSASVLIHEHYLYSFLTNSELIFQTTSPYFLNRTNIEARWSTNYCQLQLCGLNDFLYRQKRKKVFEIVRP